MADVITPAARAGRRPQHGIEPVRPDRDLESASTYVNCTAPLPVAPRFIEDGKRCLRSARAWTTSSSFCKAQVNTLWDEVKRFENPHRYYVDLSQKLWDTRSALLKKLSK